MSYSEAETMPYCDAYATLATAYREAAERDPRRFGFSYLAGDPESGALSAFLWFATTSELLDFLCTGEVALLRFDERDAARIVASLRRTIGTTRDLSRLDREQLSACYEGWCEIAWIGTFADLCAKGGSIQTAMRAEFRAACRLGEHAGPIADDELARFVAWVTGAAGESHDDRR